MFENSTSAFAACALWETLFIAVLMAEPQMAFMSQYINQMEDKTVTHTALYQCIICRCFVCNDSHMSQWLLMTAMDQAVFQWDLYPWRRRTLVDETDMRNLDMSFRSMTLCAEAAMPDFLNNILAIIIQVENFRLTPCAARIARQITECCLCRLTMSKQS